MKVDVVFGGRGVEQSKKDYLLDYNYLYNKRYLVIPNKIINNTVGLYELVQLALSEPPVTV